MKPKDFDACSKKAEQYLNKRAENGAVIGGVIAGITGAAGGHMGAGALAGSAVGENTGGPGKGNDRDQIKQDYVNQCLKNRGYSAVG